jgi:hypothetical protein
MDEVFGYFPPTANPPSKTPMLTLLKQARAYGLGIVLATQNPVDLDYKGLSNAGTWFLGRLQTERDKARVIEGLEGASAAAGSRFDRGQMEATLTALGNRVFLLNNVHEDEPVVFQTRWCLSYLRGPLARNQIQQLMASRRPAVDAPAPASAARTSAGERPDLSQAAPAATAEVYVSTPKALSDAAGPRYRPGLFATARLRFIDAKAQLDCWRGVGVLSLSAGASGVDPWADAELRLLDDWSTSAEGDPAVPRDPPPAALQNARNLAHWSKQLVAHLYRTYNLTLYKAPDYKTLSRPDESQADFRIRIQQQAREARDEAVEKLRQKYAAKTASLDDKIQRARERVAREKSQFHTSTLDTAVSVGSSILRAFLGRRKVSVTNVRGATSAARSASRTARQHGDIERAQKQLDKLLEERARLEDAFEAEVSAFDAEVANVRIEPYYVRPRKSDIAVEKLVPAWIRPPA